jgi:hypothetical protein
MAPAQQQKRRTTMPNWTSNTIRVEGCGEQIAEFLAFMRGPDDQIFDFNRIIPMPELLRHFASASQIATCSIMDSSSTRAGLLARDRGSTWCN